MREYIDGATAIVRGAIDAGCSFFAGYPITPASGILMQMMRELPRTGGVAIQGEDEIASIGMCIGATLAGDRAMTATSGPGISLYSENIGLAVMGEVPLVIVDVQRLGPGTGAATTVSQGDVQFVRWGTAGGYPIIALSPSTVVEAYELTARAFDLAERFRCPVFLLTDKELVMSLTTVDLDAYPDVSVRERQTASAGLPYSYKPPAAVHPLHEFGGEDTARFTGSTHDERAIITKDRDTIEALNRHLIAKIEDHRDEVEMVDADLQPGASTLLVGYGIVGGAIRSATAAARAEGMSVSSMVVQSLWPVPEIALASALDGVDRVVVAELNHGLYRREIERLAGDREVIGVNRIDGELISVAD
ncbi:MAG: pyruvate flavodoxin/ferredoxin oxidoreductase, partial [Acidimicrobiia bacterium]|nr:pyruvate flavodoxin/ferredoxin oxidoreductase [Acidimicrobiia bacterium]